MVRWSLIAEYFSLFIISIIFIRYYGFEWKVAFTPRRKLFLACLITSVGSTLLNIICVYCLDHAQRFPVWFNMTLNTLYFLVSITMCSLFALFLFLCCWSMFTTITAVSVPSKCCWASPPPM